MYGLPQAVILAKTLLAQLLVNHGYYQVKHTPVLWEHVWRPIVFTLIIDDFGIGYVRRENADHLMSALKIYHEKSQHIEK